MMPLELKTKLIMFCDECYLNQAEFPPSRSCSLLLQSKPTHQICLRFLKALKNSAPSKGEGN